MELINDNCLLSILKYVSISELIEKRFVCKKWNKSILEIWRTYESFGFAHDKEYITQKDIEESYRLFVQEKKITESCICYPYNLDPFESDSEQLTDNELSLE